MNSFKLPYHLIVDEGVFGRIPKVMNDVIPGIENKKTIIVTESTLKGIFSEILDGIENSFNDSEMYLIKGATYDEAVALAKYITMNDFSIVIGFATMAISRQHI